MGELQCIVTSYTKFRDKISAEHQYELTLLIRWVNSADIGQTIVSIKVSGK